MRLICAFELKYADFGADFTATFAAELARLAPMAADGLVTLDATGIRVTDAGRLLIRNICMVFDRHLAATAQQLRFSKAI